MTPDELFMRRAIELSREGMENGQTPFGAVIVRQGQIVAEGHNQVWADCDITAHGEMVCLRRACTHLQAIDLSDCDLYSSCEPCPMCFSAIHWAGIRTLYFGARIADAAAAGFRELTISNEEMREQGGSALTLIPDLLREEAADVLREFSQRFPERLY